MEVGIVGLGNMGFGMTKSLLRAGHKVAGYNRTRARAEALASSSSGEFTVADSVADACRPGVVITMVADDHALSDASFAANGVVASLPRGGVHISCSTISVALANKLASEHAAAGQQFVSAPVFGRPDAAEAARLAVVAAGEKSAIERCKPLLEAMGPKLLVIGETASQANTVKLTGNFMIATVRRNAQRGHRVRPQVWSRCGGTSRLPHQHAV